MQSEKRRGQDTRAARRGPRFVPSMITAEDISNTSDFRFKKRSEQDADGSRVFQAREIGRDLDADRPGINFTALRDAVWSNHDRFLETVGTPVLMFVSCILLCVIGYIYQHSLEKKEYAYVEGDLSELTIKAFRMPGTLTRPIRSQQLGFLSEKIQTINRKVDADEMARVIIDQASSQAFDPLIIASIIKTESAFKRKAMSHKGARGLMQLMPATARYIATKRGIEWEGLQKLNEPEYNLLLGITYFDYLLNMFDNNVEHALMAYNWGPGNVQRVLKQRGRVIPEVRKYARDILLTHKRWKTEQHLSGI